MDLTGKKMNNLERRNQSGFTLAEVMVAILILSFGFVGMLYMATFAIKANAMGRGLGQARFIAEQQSEFLRSLDYRNPLLIDDGDTLDLDDTLTADFEDTTFHDGIAYRVLWNIAEDQPNDGMKMLKIHIIWQDQVKRSHYEITTMKGEVRR